MTFARRLLCLSVLLLPAPAWAQSGGAYSLGWNSLVAGGGTFASGGDYRLGGAIGQPDAGTLASGDYRLSGGFWTQATEAVASTPPREEAVPARFAAFAPAPNPSRGAVRFAFDLPASRRVSMGLYALDGRLVRSLLDGSFAAGRHAAHWDGRDAAGHPAPAGMYFVRLVAGEHVASFRFVRLD